MTPYLQVIWAVNAVITFATAIMSFRNWRESRRILLESRAINARVRANLDSSEALGEAHFEAHQGG